MSPRSPDQLRAPAKARSRARQYLRYSDSIAFMTPGSRSWLDFYEESLAKPMADSQARVKALQQWSGEQSAP